ncbi:MAG: hypothetical protein AAGF11_15830 [Myxococcota bacterium]
MSLATGVLGAVLGAGFGVGPEPEPEPPKLPVVDAPVAEPEPEPPKLPVVDVPELVSPAAEAVALVWEAPAECPGISDVRRSLASYLGEEPAEEVGAGVQAVARVTAGEEGYRLSLRTETASGVTTRETTAEDCAVLVDATALIVAIAVDPSTVLGRSDEPAPAEPEPEPEPGPLPVEPEPELESPPEVFGSVEPEPEPEPGAERRVRFGLQVGGGVDGGMLPGPAGGLRLTGVLIGTRWRVELHGDYWFPRTAITEPGLGGRVSAGLGGVRGCGVLGIERVGLEFPLCVGLEAGLLRGDPVGDRVAAPETSRQPWVAADASAALAWVPRRFFALFVRAELVVPIVRAGFRVGDNEVHRTGLVAGRGLAGLEARFP